MIIKIFQLLILVFGSILLAPSIYACGINKENQLVIQIFKETEHEIPIDLSEFEDDGWTIEIINADAAFNLEKQMSEGLPNNYEDAEKHLTSLFHGPEGTKISDQFISAWRQQMALRRAGIEKVPAVLVAGRFVGYGTLNPMDVISKCEFSD